LLSNELNDTVGIDIPAKKDAKDLVTPASSLHTGQFDSPSSDGGSTVGVKPPRVAKPKGKGSAKKKKKTNKGKGGAKGGDSLADAQSVHSGGTIKPAKIPKHLKPAQLVRSKARTLLDQYANVQTYKKIKDWLHRVFND
jgi:hypothetical protein